MVPYGLGDRTVERRSKDLNYFVEELWELRHCFHTYIEEVKNANKEEGGSHGCATLSMYVCMFLFLVLFQLYENSRSHRYRAISKTYIKKFLDQIVL